MRLVILFVGVLLCCGCATQLRQDSLIFNGPRVLGVVAHPDDETAFAATLYAVTHRLSGHGDLVCITDGQGGYKYSTLSEPLYGLRLTDEAVGRRELPAIRRREMEEAASILGVDEVHFLEQPDHRYSQDEMEILASGAEVWDVALVKEKLRRIITAGQYEFVFVLLPTATTHGHHKAAAILALDVVNSLPLAQRPIVLGTQVRSAHEETEPYATLKGHPLTTPSGGAPFVFDRMTPLGHKGRLHLRIIVDWVIAAHKSQGTMQQAAGQGGIETFTLFAISPPGAVEQTQALFELLRASVRRLRRTSLIQEDISKK